MVCSVFYSLKSPPFCTFRFIFDLSKVSGIAKPFEVLAILGASGSGKTTLLNVLNFRNRGSLKIQGDIKVNGIFIDSVEKISALSGYVQQDDLFIGTLKVREHLLFQVIRHIT
jgi:ABC-type multidrug transport system ATPase subunit